MMITGGRNRAYWFKRTLWIVAAAQVLAGGGLAAGITVGSLLAQDMLGDPTVSGLPIAIFTLGSAAAAWAIGRLTQKLGRRRGLAAGFAAGGLGSSFIVLAAALNSFALLVPALFIYGAGMAANLQARFAGTDLALEKQRATAVSFVLVATTFGAVAGPFLVDVTGRFAESMQLPALSGPFILAALAYFGASLILTVFLRPDPMELAAAFQKEEVETDGEAHVDKEITYSRKGVMSGAFIMVLSQLIMVALMTMTPVHMQAHGHHLQAVGIVIGLHIGAMYLPSLVTGKLIDLIGRRAMTAAAGIILLLSGLLAAASGGSFILITAALMLLGLGWNIGLISGTAMIVDHAPLDERAAVQGKADIFVALSGASGGALSGMVAAGTGFPGLAVIGGLLSLLLIPVVFQK
ncbi:MFS transporter [Alkalicoccus urumqiensis]|uniref:MFS transporter n=1 Tax=Alkalicoccus urumqiensis TaxID=1548213 RepID=A0A2P6MIP7_ALKUR|nr:MFS transporter [Alkalicoccus urumqiensis]PRO66172.1 MFS transporter [Alkalicoccus urumqiensis]